MAASALTAVLCLAGAAGRADAADAGPSPASGPEHHPRPIVDTPALFTPDDLLLLEVTAAGQPMSEGFGAYSSRAGVFIPIGELCRLLDLAVTVDPENRRAEGWVLAESRRVGIDLASGQAQANGKTISLPKQAAAVFDGDIYIRADLVEQLLPLKLKVDTSAATLTITPTEPLPFQERLERDQRRKSLGAQNTGSEDALVLKSPYRPFTAPSVSVDLNAVATNHGPPVTGVAEIRAAGDLAYAGAQLYLSADQTGRLTDGTFMLERKDPAGRTAGPFGATRWDLGDTFSPAMPIGAGSVSGRGMAITSAPLSQQVVFNKVDLRGELPAGYQVELYVNEVLRGSQSEPVNGRYEFLAVPLGYGLNVIRLVFYGPRGERRETVQRLNVGGAQLAAGQTTYSLGVVQQGRTVFPFALDSAPSTQLTPGMGELDVTGIVSHGLTNATTLTAGVARYTPSLSGPREMAMLGVDTSWSGVAVQADAARDSQGGSALAFGMAGLAHGTSITARDAEYFGGFRDELQALDTQPSPLRRDTSLWINASPRLLGAALPTVLRMDRSQFSNGQTEYQATAQVSRPVDSYLLSSALSYQSTSSLGPARGIANLSGELDASRIVDGGWQVRGSLGYEVQPRARLSFLSLTADHNTSNSTALHLGVMQAFGPGAETTFQVGNTWRVGQNDVSLIAAYTTRLHEVSIGVHVSLGFLFDPERHAYRAADPSVAEGASAIVQAYVDKDGDGRMDAGDMPEPDLAIQGGRRPAKTDARGEAMVTGLGKGDVAQLAVDTASIEDPYMTPPPRLIRFVPRPGQVMVVPYGMHETGEVEVDVVFQRPGAPARPLSALMMQLVAPGGEVAASGHSEYDGALLLENLRPGEYQLRIDPEQSQRLRLELAQPVHVTVPAKGGFIGHIKAVVRRQGEEAAPAAPAVPLIVASAEAARPAPPVAAAEGPDGPPVLQRALDLHPAPPARRRPRPEREPTVALLDLRGLADPRPEAALRPRMAPTPAAFTRTR